MTAEFGESHTIPMDGEVYDEVEETPDFNFYNQVIFPLRKFVLLYGWYLIGGAFLAYHVFIRFIQPRLFVRRSDGSAGEKKKNDDLNTDRYRDAVRAARDRQQQRHYEVAAEHVAEQKRIEERKKEEKMQKMMEELAQRSVGGEGNLADYKKISEEKKKIEESKKKSEDKNARGDEARESDADFLQRVISSAPIVIISKSFCPYSRKAKHCFALYRLSRDEVAYIELDELEEAREAGIKAEMQRLYGIDRVPLVFINRVPIGNADTISAHQREGILDELVKEAVDKWRNK